MKAFRISGTHRRTDRREAIQVCGNSYQEAMQVMRRNYKRLFCQDKRGVEIVRG